MKTGKLHKLTVTALFVAITLVFVSTDSHAQYYNKRKTATEQEEEAPKKGFNPYMAPKIGSGNNNLDIKNDDDDTAPAEQTGITAEEAEALSAPQTPKAAPTVPTLAAPTANYADRFEHHIERDSTTDQIKSCRLSWRHYTEDGRRFDAGLSFFTGNTDGGELFYSMRITGARGEKLTLENEGWIEFGEVNTRFIKLSQSVMQQAVQGALPVDRTVPILVNLIRKKPVFNFSVSGEKGMVRVVIDAPANGPVQEAANCIYSLNPGMETELRKAGFNVHMDELHHDALNLKQQAQGRIYNTSYWNADPENPGACIWSIGPFTKNRDDFAISFITSGYIEDGHEYNYTTAIILTGIRNTSIGQSKYRIENAVFSAKTPEGQKVSTSQFQPAVRQGTRYEMRMSLDAASPFVSAIAHSGLDIYARIPERSHPLDAKIPPPKESSYVTYVQCMNLLMQDLEKRSQGME